MKESFRAMNKRLKQSLIFTTSVMAIEFFGAYISGSIALASDALHMSTHAIALLTTWLARRASLKMPTSKQTYGYHRLRVFSAALNGILLFVLVFFILSEAIERIMTPQVVLAREMLVVAVVGLMANLYVVNKLRKGRALDIKGAYFHVLGDTLFSIVIVFAAIWIHFTGQYMVDALVSIGISALILFWAVKLMKEAMNILMEGVPEGLTVRKVIKEMKQVDGVESVHHVHLWAIGPSVNAISAHIVVSERNVHKAEKIVTNLERRLKKFDIHHATFQPECRECQPKLKKPVLKRK